MTNNLLRNPGFEDGAYPFDPQGIVYVPKEWRLTFREGQADKRPGQDLPWGRPNAGCLSPAQFPPHEWPQFFEQESQVLWKVWTGRSFPFSVTLSQTVALQPGARYRFTARVQPDMVEAYTPQGKVYSTNPEIGAARAFARSGGQAVDMDFVKVGALPNGRYSPVALEFTAPAAEVEIGVEAYGLFGIENLCFFFDNFELVEAAPPAPQFTAPAGNLLASGSFEDGQAYFTDEARAVAVPAGWLLEVKSGRPTAALLDRRQAAPADQGRLFVVGDYAWRVSGAPFEVRLWQAVSGLSVGRAYRATALVLPEAAGQFEAALAAQTGERGFSTGWQGAAGLPAGRYSRLELVFTAAAASVYVSLELRAAAGAWVVDLAALEAQP